MLECVHCGWSVDVENLTNTVAYPTIGATGQDLGLEWAHIECEAASIKTPAQYINTEMRDDDTYLTIAAMQNALDANRERQHELVYTPQ
jgi:hypothetical protein